MQADLVVQREVRGRRRDEPEEPAPPPIDGREEQRAEGDDRRRRDARPREHPEVAVREQELDIAVERPEVEEIDEGLERGRDDREHERPGEDLGRDRRRPVLRRLLGPRRGRRPVPRLHRSHLERTKSAPAREVNPAFSRNRARSEG